jgi:hypothetical protein
VHLEAVARVDVRHRLDEIRVPTLVVCGRHDPLAPAADCAALRDGIPGAEPLVLEHTAHGGASAGAADRSVLRTRVTAPGSRRPGPAGRGDGRSPDRRRTALRSALRTALRVHVVRRANESSAGPGR